MPSSIPLFCLTTPEGTAPLSNGFKQGIAQAAATPRIGMSTKIPCTSIMADDFSALINDLNKFPPDRLIQPIVIPQPVAANNGSYRTLSIPVNGKRTNQVVPWDAGWSNPTSGDMSYNCWVKLKAWLTAQGLMPRVFAFGICLTTGYTNDAESILVSSDKGLDYSAYWIGGNCPADGTTQPGVGYTDALLAQAYHDVFQGASSVFPGYMFQLAFFNPSQQALGLGGDKTYSVAFKLAAAANAGAVAGGGIMLPFDQSFVSPVNPTRFQTQEAALYGNFGCQLIPELNTQPLVASGLVGAIQLQASLIQVHGLQSTWAQAFMAQFGRALLVTNAGRLTSYPSQGPISGLQALKNSNVVLDGAGQAVLDGSNGKVFAQ